MVNSIKLSGQELLVYMVAPFHGGVKQILSGKKWSSAQIVWPMSKVSHGNDAMTWKDPHSLTARSPTSKVRVWSTWLIKGPKF